MKKNIIWILLILLVSGICFGQNAHDTIVLPVKSNQNETGRLYKAISSLENKDPDPLCALYYRLGRFYARESLFDSAYKYYDLSLAIANETENMPRMATVNNMIGSFYSRIGDYEEALKYYKKSDGIYKVIGNQTGIASLANNLGEIERFRGAYEKALEYYYSALKINKQYSQFLNLSINHTIIGFTFAYLQKYDSSIYHLKIAERIAEQNNLETTMNMIQDSLGIYYM